MLKNPSTRVLVQQVYEDLQGLTSIWVQDLDDQPTKGKWSQKHVHAHIKIYIAIHV